MKISLSTFANHGALRCKLLGLRSYASMICATQRQAYLAMNDASLLSISKVLGHQTTKMTERYSHLATSYIDEVARSMNQEKFGKYLPQF